MHDTDQPHTTEEIHLEAVVCATSHYYDVIFEGPNAEGMALDYIDQRGRTHAFHVPDEHPLPARYERLWDYLFPSCDHGLSLWLCADPINHYPPDP